MARQGTDLYNIGTTPEELQRALIDLRQEFDAHIHDGSNSRGFQTINAETISAHTFLIRKTSYADTAVGIWMGIDEGDGVMKLKLGSGSSYLQWNGSTLSVVGSITATSGTIGGWTIGATTLTGGGITLDSTGTITGGVIRTSSGSTRVEMNSSGNAFNIYSSGVLRATGAATGWAYYNSSGTVIAMTFAAASSIGIHGQQTSSSIFLEPGSSGTVAFLKSGDPRILFSPTLDIWAPYVAGSVDLGATGAEWGSLFLDDVFDYQGVEQPVAYYGLVDDDGDENSSPPFPTGWSSAKNSTGVYTVTHNLSDNDYVVALTILAASGALHAKVGDRNLNDFEVRTFNDAGTLTDASFFFAVFQKP